MRLKVVLILFFISSSAQAQDYFIVRAAKDSLDGFMTFYDTKENEVPVMLSFTPDLQLATFSLSYSIQQKSKGNRSLDIYSGEIPLDKANFNYAIPINDTFIKSGNYRVVFRLSKKETIVQEQDIYFQTLRTPNNYYKAKRKVNKLIQNRVIHSYSDIDLDQTFVAGYNLKRIKMNINALMPIAERSEQGALEGITQNDNLEEQKRFFYNFWYSRNPQNPEAEWKAYATKLNYASRKYGYGSLKGYQTDKGMLYLKFGPPNREIRASNEKGTKPYEVWFYAELDRYTNLNILFVQQGSLTNERVMTHSSDPNFFFNPYWASQLFTDPSEQLNRNSHRVYEFFK